MTVEARFFAKVFGFTHVPVLGDSEFYYFEQTVDEDNVKNSVQVRKAKVDMFAKALGPSAGLPGPFITGIVGNIENGFPTHLLVCPAMGADVVMMYHRDGEITEGGQSG